MIKVHTDIIHLSSVQTQFIFKKSECHGGFCLCVFENSRTRPVYRIKQIAFKDFNLRQTNF
jgi:hypothetical protein